MSQPIDAAREFLQADGWTFHQEGEHQIKLTVSGKAGKWLVLCQFSPGSGIYHCWSYCPVTIPEDRRADVADFLTRANWGMGVGCFELDLSDGEIRFKSALLVRHHALGAAEARDLMYVGLAMMDRYLPGILSVMGGSATPLDAVNACERFEPTDLARPKLEQRQDQEELDISDAKMREIFAKVMGRPVDGP